MLYDYQFIQFIRRQENVDCVELKHLTVHEGLLMYALAFPPSSAKDPHQLTDWVAVGDLPADSRVIL